MSDIYSFTLIFTLFFTVVSLLFSAITIKEIRDAQAYRKIESTMLEKNKKHRQEQLQGLRAQVAKDQVLAEAQRFQNDIAAFPGHRNYCGQPFSGWQVQLQDMVERGLSLDRPSEHFSRLKKAVIDSLAFNHDRVALASLVSDPNTQVSLAFASHHVADAQACLLHLQSIEAKWAQDRFDAMDHATAPAMGVSKRAGRL